MKYKLIVDGAGHVARRSVEDLIRSWLEKNVEARVLDANPDPSGQNYSYKIIGDCRDVKISLHDEIKYCSITQTGETPWIELADYTRNAVADWLDALKTEVISLVACEIEVEL